MSFHSTDARPARALGLASGDPEHEMRPARKTKSPPLSVSPSHCLPWSAEALRSGRTTFAFGFLARARNEMCKKRGGVQCSTVCARLSHIRTYLTASLFVRSVTFNTVALRLCGPAMGVGVSRLGQRSLSVEEEHGDEQGHGFGLLDSLA